MGSPNHGFRNTRSFSQFESVSISLTWPKTQEVFDNRKMGTTTHHCSVPTLQKALWHGPVKNKKKPLGTSKGPNLLPHPLRALLVSAWRDSFQRVSLLIRFGVFRFSFFSAPSAQGKATHPKKPPTQMVKSSLHKQFAQTLSACFLLILKGKGGDSLYKLSRNCCANCAFIWVGGFFRWVSPPWSASLKHCEEGRVQVAARKGNHLSLCWVHA